MNINLYIEEFYKIVEKIQTDTSLLLIVSISIAVALGIVLIVLISAMTIRSLKNHLFNERSLNKLKIKEISKLTREVKVFDTKNKSIKEQLKDYEELKIILEKRNDEIEDLKKQKEIIITSKNELTVNHENIKKENSKLKSELNLTRKRNEDLVEEKRQNRIKRK